MVRSTPAGTQMTHKQVHIWEEQEVSPRKREPKCSFCREETHSYQTCQVLKQMIIKQADELTRWRVAEYEKSQGEAIRHTILEEYGPATCVRPNELMERCLCSAPPFRGRNRVSGADGQRSNTRGAQLVEPVERSPG